MSDNFIDDYAEEEPKEVLKNPKETLAMFCAMAFGVLMAHNPGMDCSEIALKRAKQMQRVYEDELKLES